MENLRQQLIRHEGLKLRLYTCPAGKLTIGVGHNIEDLGISKAVALQQLDEDIERSTLDLLHALPWVADLDRVRRDVLINMAFNMGIKTLLSFERMLGYAQLGAWEAAHLEGLDSKWARQVGPRAAELMQQLLTGERPA